MNGNKGDLGTVIGTKERARALGNEFDLQIWVNFPHFLAESFLVSRWYSRGDVRRRPSLRVLLSCRTPCGSRGDTRPRKGAPSHEF